MHHHSSQTRGEIALMAILLVGSVILIYGLSVALMNTDTLVMSQAWLQTSKSRSLNSSCVDNVLTRLRNDTSLNGNVNIGISNVNCVASISGSGNIKTIYSSATSSDAYGRAITSRVKVNVNINTNPFTIVQYKDILD